MVKRRGTCLSLFVPQTSTQLSTQPAPLRVHAHSSSHLWCLMMVCPSVCRPRSPCYVHPEHTSQQGDSCSCHRLCFRPCGRDNTLQPLPVHQEQHPYLCSLGFSSSHTLRMRKHLPRPRCKKGSRCRQKANGNMMTWQLEDVELNTGIRSMLEQGRDVHLFFRRDKTTMLAAATKLKSFFQL